MNTNLTELIQYLENKEICLLGNSQSILKNKKDIDGYEVICRMNLGTPQKNEIYIGSRTDVLFTSTRFTEELKNKFNAKYIMWMTECSKLASDLIKQYAFQNPIGDWRELKAKFPGDRLPSTGMIVLNFLIKYINFGSLTIYGFDNFTTGTFYHRVNAAKWHEGALEKTLMTELINNNPKIKWIIE